MFEIGEKYYSYTAVQKKVEAYIIESGIFLTKRNCVTIDSLEDVPLGITRNVKKQTTLWYSVLNYFCEYGEQRQAPTHDGAKRTRTKKIGCQFVLKFECKVDKLVCIKVGQHLDHYKGTLKRPKLTDKQIEEVKTAAESKASISHLTTNLNQKYKLELKNKDLHNLLRRFDKQKTYKTHYNKLLQQGIIKSITDDKNKEIAVLYQSRIMKELWAQYNDCMLIDSTFSILKKKWSLFTIIIVNGDGQSEPVCLFLIKDESIKSLCYVFDELTRENDFDRIETWLSDKDLREHAIVKEYSLNAGLNLCYFHVKRAFQRHFTNEKCQLNNDERKEELSKVYKIILCSNDNNYNYLVSRLSNKTIGYYNIYWHPIKDEFIEYFKLNKMNLALRTTNRVESFLTK